jgi:hypothetical protein
LLTLGLPVMSWLICCLVMWRMLVVLLRWLAAKWLAGFLLSYVLVVDLQFVEESIHVVG